MLLCDRDLRQLLPQMQFETGDHRRPFNPQEQIQPCSIDLRLDRCFWEPKKPSWFPAIDFRDAQKGQVVSSRLWQRRWCKLGEGITVKPGRMILGRTLEKFTVPNGYAGKLEGRSTFARL